VIDFVNRWQEATEMPITRFVGWLAISRSKFFDWRNRYGKVNEHNEWIPRDHWLEDWEKRAIIEYYTDHPLEGYRRLAFMMLDDNVAAVSPSSVYRVLVDADLLNRWNRKESKKGTGFVQPTRPHQHWHIDIAHLNLGGTFYYLCAIIDGYSRYIVHWEILAQMKSGDVELIVQRALERFPGEHPRLISDNGPQFVSRDFEAFIREAQMKHVRTSPYYPQSNGKVERFYKTYRGELRFDDPATVEEAREATERIVSYYNDVRLHSGIGYVAPKAKLEGREVEIFAERDRKLQEARERRAAARSAQRAEKLATKLQQQTEVQQTPAPDVTASCEAEVVTA
jgi:putative transposase